MNIKKLIAYSKIDNERRKELKRFQSLPVVKEYNKLRSIINKAKLAVEKINKDAEETIKQMNAITQKYNEVFSSLKETEQNFAHIEDENEADYYIKSISNHIATLNQLAQDAKVVSAKIASQKEQYEALMQAGREATLKARELTPEYTKCLNESKAVRLEFEQKLAELEKDIDKEEMAKYKQIAEEDKYPVVHVLKDSYCFCRIEMPGSVTQKVKSVGWGFCPDCGRILISEDAYNNAK